MSLWLICVVLAAVEIAMRRMHQDHEAAIRTSHVPMGVSIDHPAGVYECGHTGMFHPTGASCDDLDKSSPCLCRRTAGSMTIVIIVETVTGTESVHRAHEVEQGC